MDTQNTVATATNNDDAVQLTFFSTGTLRIRPTMRSQSASSFALLRRIKSLCDRRWTEPFPVGVFLIRHPEGLFLMDTGQSPRCIDTGPPPRLALFKGRHSEFTIQRQEGILEQLHKHGIRAADLKSVILSHHHKDHIGGLHDLLTEAPNLPVYISRQNWEAFGKHPLLASMEGATSNPWPKCFTPRKIDFESHPVGPWQQSYPLTEDGKIVIVDTSGHAPGHISVIVYGDDESEGGGKVTYFLPGDATFSLDLLEKEDPGGVNEDPKRAVQTLKTINEFARGTDVVVLPSHDTTTPQLLADRAVYRPSQREVEIH
ncbi:beta-lactamase-like protein [Aspergillus alliaceus]|uniref:Beta-lactamase-like protein n=1 Tax=Petromyces alliaceus TaxID=209559 RepID=A0A5N7BVA8_PETAA|nr:beta-lactamase-like protein [Aspergillus alliaceus]